MRVSLALPAAGASATTDAIDLDSASPRTTLEDVDWQISVPALPALVADKTVTVTIQDSANGIAFAAIPGLAPLEITGGEGNGAEAVEHDFKLPPTVRQYVRAHLAVAASGGNNTGVEVTLKALF